MIVLKIFYTEANNARGRRRQHGGRRAGGLLQREHTDERPLAVAQGMRTAHNL